MPTVTFRKKIVGAGKYRLPDGRTEELTSERLAEMTETANSMLKAGLAIPAPWSHKDHQTPYQVGSDGTLPRSDTNAGFWKAFTYDPKEKAVYGVLEAEGDPNDLNTPAGKIGKTVRETSVYVRPNFVDGRGRPWGPDAMMHVALVTHPVEPGQENFTPHGIALAMSMAEEGNERKEPPSLQKETPPSAPEGKTPPDDMQKPGEKADPCAIVCGLLKERLGIELPSDTTKDNILERLQVALMQKTPAGRPAAGSTRQPPEGSMSAPAPIAMSQLPQEVQDFIAHQTSRSAALEGQLNLQARQSYTSRIVSLVKGGRVSKDYADKSLRPLVEGFQMSFDAEGKRSASPLDTILDALEQAPGSAFSQNAGLPPGAMTQDYPTYEDDGSAALSPEDVDKAAESLLSI